MTECPKDALDITRGFPTSVLDMTREFPGGTLGTMRGCPRYDERVSWE